MNTWVLLVTWFCQTLMLPSRVTAQDCLTYPDNSPGDCIIIQRCPSLNSLLQQAKGSSSNSLKILRKSVCANDASGVRLCCPRATTKPTTSNPTRLECGHSLQFDRIVNGEDADLGSWPWMVIFRAREIRNSAITCRDINPSCSGWAGRGECQSNPGYMHANCRRSCNKCPSVKGQSNWICGGVFITEQFVLTAAHCFSNNVEIEYARIGEFDLSKNPDTREHLTAPTPQNIPVERVILHPEYGSPCRRCNDIALVKLIRPIQLHPFFVQPICLPSNPERDMGYPVSAFQGKLSWAAGWGVTYKVDTISGSDILQQVNLTIQERSYCHQQKAKYPDDRMILCAGGDGGDPCRGDSGGPVMLSDRFGKKWYVVGITSFGSAICGDRSAQAIFTSVHHYMDWINQNIS